MSLPREALLELMALADDELEGEAKARAERLVGESEEARRVVDSIRAPHLGKWLGASMHARAAGADGIADAVMARLVDSGTGSVANLPTLRSRRQSRAGYAFAAGGSALAIAAGMALYVRSVNNRNAEDVPVAVVGAPEASLLSPQSVVLARADEPQNRGVEVNEIDSPSRGVSVFEIPVSAAGAAAAANASGSPRVVIWIEDDQGAK